MRLRRTSRELYAFVDEAGQRASTAASSDHFILSAVVFDASHREDARQLVSDLKADLDRAEDHTLHWRNFRSHSQRLRAAQRVGGAEFLTISSVIVCKRNFSEDHGLDVDLAYMYTFRLLLERLSWLARDSARELHYTLAHVIRFKKETLREYESRLRADMQCEIAWDCLDQAGGSIDQPSRVVELQLADIAASATFKAFEPDRFGNTERRYLEEIAPKLYRRPPGQITSYGMKMHPWNERTRAAHPWVAAL